MLSNAVLTLMCIIKEGCIIEMIKTKDGRTHNNWQKEKMLLWVFGGR